MLAGSDGMLIIAACPLSRILQAHQRPINRPIVHQVAKDDVRTCTCKACEATWAARINDLRTAKNRMFKTIDPTPAEVGNDVVQGKNIAVNISDHRQRA